MPQRFRNPGRATIVLLLLGTMAGCATLSESECQFSDWHDIGFRDGRQGHPSDRIGAHVKACGEYGIAPDRERYHDGHFAGLQSYCTPHSGLAAGRAGQTYSGVCVSHDERAFLAGYALGSSVHRARHRLHSIDAEIAGVEARLKNKEATEEERALALYRRVQLEGERGAAQAELSRLEWEAQSF